MWRGRTGLPNPRRWWGFAQPITVRNVVAARLWFHRYLSFCSRGGGGCVPQHALGRIPRADYPLGRYPSRVDTLPPGKHPRPHPAATAADGTHPSGMHSWFFWPFFSKRMDVNIGVCSSSNTSLTAQELSVWLIQITEELPLNGHQHYHRHLAVKATLAL